MARLVKATSLLGMVVTLSCGEAPSDGEDCFSTVSWWGSVKGTAESLSLMGCINEDCLSRDVIVAVDGTCDQRPHWTDDWAISACARQFEQDPNELEIMVSLDLTPRQAELGPGDVAKLEVVNTETGDVLYERVEPMQFSPGDDDPCVYNGFTFGGIDGAPGTMSLN